MRWTTYLYIHACAPRLNGSVVCTPLDCCLVYPIRGRIDETVTRGRIPIYVLHICVSWPVRTRHGTSRHCTGKYQRKRTRVCVPRVRFVDFSSLFNSMYRAYIRMFRVCTRSARCHARCRWTGPLLPNLQILFSSNGSFRGAAKRVLRVSLCYGRRACLVSEKLLERSNGRARLFGVLVFSACLVTWLTHTQVVPLCGTTFFFFFCEPLVLFVMSCRVVSGCSTEMRGRAGRTGCTTSSSRGR